MKAIKTGLMTIALLAATAACDGAPTASSAFISPTDEAALAQAKSRLTFSYTQSNTDQTAQTSSGSVGAIDFTGSVTTGTPCYDVTADHTVRGSSVTLTVTATSTGGICTQVITYNNYQGDISRLSPGTYDFTVVHDVNGNTSTAHTSTVVVL